MQVWKNEMNEQVYPPFQAEAAAEKAGEERIPLVDSTGRIALEYAYLYPPGIPLTVPGERISAETARMFRQYERSGLRIEGTKRTGMIGVLPERMN